MGAHKKKPPRNFPWRQSCLVRPKRVYGISPVYVAGAGADVLRPLLAINYSANLRRMYIVFSCNFCRFYARI